MPLDTITPAESTTNRNQMTLSGIFWVTTAVAIAFGYALQFGQSEAQLAAVYCGWVLLFGMLIGATRRDWPNALFWGGLYSLLAFLAILASTLWRLASWGDCSSLLQACFNGLRSSFTSRDLSWPAGWQSAFLSATS